MPINNAVIASTVNGPPTTVPAGPTCDPTPSTQSGKDACAAYCTSQLDLALDAGCLISIDTDSHSPGHLEFVNYGCDKAVAHGIDPDRIINTWSADDLLAWTRDRAAA